MSLLISLVVRGLTLGLCSAPKAVSISGFFEINKAPLCIWKLTLSEGLMPRCFLSFAGMVI